MPLRSKSFNKGYRKVRPSLSYYPCWLNSTIWKNFIHVPSKQVDLQTAIGGGGGGGGWCIYKAL